MIVFLPSRRGSGWRVGLLIAAGAAIAGCGAPQEATRGATRQTPEATAAVAPELKIAPTRPAPAERVADDAGARAPAVAASPHPAGSLAPARVELKLVATSIGAAKAFAVLKTDDRSTLTVRPGDEVEGYTIASIEPDRVRLKSRGGGEKVLVLGDAGGDGAAGRPANEGPAAYAAGSALITEGVNTDQSLPEHPTFGPTARLPEGMRQIGH